MNAQAHNAPWSERVGLIRQRALYSAAGGWVLCLLAWLVQPQWLFPSYLVAFLFWVGISVSCVALLMLHRLVGGLWGFVVRAPAEAGAMTVPLMALLFVPIALGLRYLYPWADPSEAAKDPLIQAKVKYLNVNFFLIRAVIYFVIWSGLAAIMIRGARAQDRTTDTAPTRRLQTVSGPGLALYFLAVTFAVVDWGMSLEPDWFSTIYGPMLLVGWVLGMLATMIIVASKLADLEPLKEVATHEGFNELGNLLLAFVMLWAYMSFSQYLITWSGNLAEEVPWYLRRSEGGWRVVAFALIVFHFFVPFFLLLSRDRKRNSRALARVAVAILVMRFIDNIWLVLPAFKAPNVLVFWPVVPAMLAVGGLWVAVFAGRLRTGPLLPHNDPQLAAALEHHGE
jgi:hypothetical protein